MLHLKSPSSPTKGLAPALRRELVRVLQQERALAPQQEPALRQALVQGRSLVSP